MCGLSKSISSSAHKMVYLCIFIKVDDSMRGENSSRSGIGGYAIQQAAGLALPLTFLKFSRGAEKEADRLGAQYMWAAGYDPQALSSFFEKLKAKDKKKPGTLAKAFASHPQTPDRISELQKEMATILPTKDQYLISSSEFDDVKARLAALENRRKLNDAKDDGRPTLRRASQKDGADKDNKDGKTEDEDRPTLKKPFHMEGLGSMLQSALVGKV